MKGRFPITIAEKRQKGDVAKRGANKWAHLLEAHGDVPVGCPELPSGLTLAGRRFWEQVVKDRQEAGLLRKMDGPILEQLARLWEDERTARRSRPRKWAAVNEARKNMIALFDRLGMHDVARARLNIKKPAEVDPLEAALAG